MRKDLLILGGVAAIVIIGAIFITNSYRSNVQNQRVTSNTNSNASNTNSQALIRPDSPSMGPTDAMVTIVEFLDPECESCRAMAPIVKKLMKDYEGRVRLVVRYMPLHKNSLLAASWTESAGEQGKYWQMQELIFQRQPEWGTKHDIDPDSSAQPDAKKQFEKYAMELGLDVEKMLKAVEDHRFTSKITRDQADGQSLGVKSTPTFFVNGRRLARLGEGELKALIDEELRNR
jgi:protein-disulfide isomerase